MPERFSPTIALIATMMTPMEVNHAVIPTKGSMLAETTVSPISRSSSAVEMMMAMSPLMMKIHSTT